MRKYVLTCVFLGLAIVGCATKETTPQPTPENLLKEELTKNGISYAIFFKTYPNDVPRALVTNEGQNLGGDWYFWNHVYYKDGQWQPGAIRDKEVHFSSVDGRRLGGTLDSSSYVEAYPDSFYVLTEVGQKPKFVVIAVWKRFVDFAGRKWEDAVCQEAHRIVIDSEGYLTKVPIPEWTMMDVDVDFDDPNEEPFPRIKLNSPHDKLERIPVQTFNPKE